MRLALELSHCYSFLRLPASNNYAVASLIYHILQNSSTEYSRRLHSKGYIGSDRIFKLFTFSQLLLPKGFRWQWHSDGTMSTNARNITLLISSPVQEFIEHLVIGLMREPHIDIAERPLRVESVRKNDSPEFSDTMNFIMLSPLFCSYRDTGERYARFLFQNDDLFEPLLYQNLRRKYEALHGKAYELSPDARFRFTIAADYLERNPKECIRMVTLKRGHPDETQIKATFAPFTLTAPKDLMEIGYHCGFGEKNSMGFGMVREYRRD